MAEGSSRLEILTGMARVVLFSCRPVHIQSATPSFSFSAARYFSHQAYEYEFEPLRNRAFLFTA